MTLSLRIDVDKPYGNHTLLRKIASKAIEESGFQPFSLGYLDHLQNFIDVLNETKVKAIFYFRICTLPPPSLLNQLITSGHAIGWHAENTKNIITFKKELNTFINKLDGFKPHSFSKHGSGFYKLGRYHFAPYEPDKYYEWSKEIEIPFLSGNNIITSTNDILENIDYAKYVFWVEKEYRSPNYQIADLIKDAKTKDITVICHPENFIRHSSCRNDLIEIINSAKKNQITWKVSIS